MRKLLLSWLLCMIAVTLSAHDIEVKNSDGVTIYYNWINDKTELKVTYRGRDYDDYKKEYSGSVVIPESVTYEEKTYSVTNIGYRAFSGCSGLTSITIPEGVTSISDNAFFGCSGLTSITIPEGVTSISDYAFFGCSGLTSVQINNRFIGDWFSICNAITILEISEKIDSISPYAFYRKDQYRVDSLREIRVAEANPYFTAIDGVLYNKAVDSLICYPFSKPDETWTTPSTLRSMSPDFCYVTGPLKEITFSGAMKFFYTPGYSAERTENLKIHFLQDCSLIKITNSGTKKCDYYIPKGTLKSFEALYYSTTDDSHIYEVEGDVIWSETVFNASKASSIYYDVDGDGVMEYQSEKISTNYSEFYNPMVTPINGNGDLMYYMDELDIDYNGRVSSFIKGIVDYENLKDKYYLLADIDNDGRKDLVSYYSYPQKKFTIHYQQPDGTFKAVEQGVTLDAEAAAKEALPKSGGISSFAVGMMANDGSGKIYSAYLTAFDINNDGILDMMDNSKGGVLYSYDDNKFFTNPKKGVLYPCDLNGNSELDYICYDGSAISLLTRVADTTYNEKQLFANSNVSKIVYKDFDHDGDIDIMAYIPTNNNSKATYFVFFRNDGDLSFKRKERNFNAYYVLEEIKDVDADGLYEMLIIDKTNNYTKLLKIGSDFSVTEFDYNFDDKGSNGYTLIGDFDNDGKTDYRYIASVVGGTKIGNFSHSINTAPKKMEAPTAVLNAEMGRLLINWKQGEDAETSSCDLTYELRIGTQSASGDVLFGASLADGTRRTLDDGNMGRALSTLFNAKSLKPGKYYISVQAIDGGGRGGAWSDDFVYEHQLTAPGIVSNYIDQMTTADTLMLTVKTPIEGADYQWTLSEGRIIKNEGNSMECIFEHDGSHTINLAMTVDGVTMNAEPMTIGVEPAKYVKRGYEPGYIDLNQDGYPEYLGYVNDGQGNLEKVLLSYVTSVKSADIYMDYNMDGYPDAIFKNNVLINSGEQDNDFEIQQQTFDWHYYLTGSSRDYINTSDNVSIPSRWFDANNDGYLDNRHCFNDGTNIVWRPYAFTDEKYALKNKYGNVANRNYGYYELDYPNYDVNRDGMLDIVKIIGKSDYDDSYRKWYVFYKDSTENISYTAPQLMYEANCDAGWGNWLLEDLNNDGYVDLLYVYNSYYAGYKLVVVKGGTTLPYTETVTYNLPKYIELKESNIQDFNNDGYVDIEYVDYLFKFGPDFTAELIEKSEYLSYYEFMVQKDGGYPGGFASHITNIPPSAPASVAAKQTKDGLLITWSDAEDDHTPAMQMRYNISVKRKGKKGDNSFVISPMNGLKDEATICGTIIYKKSTQMLVPASVLTAGETYEIQVQAIDLWNQHSPMTKAVEFTMSADGYVDLAEKVAVGKETAVKFVGTNASSYSIDAGADATIVSNLGNGQYIVKWASEGVKDITLTAGAKTMNTSITVVKPVDLAFSVPEQVFAGVPLTIAVSDEMSAEPKNVGMRSDNNKVSVKYVTGSKTAEITFPSVGTYTLEAYSTDDVRGGSYSQTVNVTEKMPKATIDNVSTDSETGCYVVNWSTSLPAGINEVIVSKEGATLGTFNVLDTVLVSDGKYVDISSNPAVMSARYRIQLLADNGQMSEVSNPHKPLHVMLAKAVNGYNLIWNRYEGVSVDSYHIMRGTSPDNMQLIAQVAGSQMSYTDLTMPDGENFYAVAFQLSGAQHMNAKALTATATAVTAEDVNSNVISTADAVDIVEAKSIELIVLDEDRTLNDEHKELQLYYMLLPTYTTISKVKWEILEGSDIASIDANGKLSATGGDGTVKVKVSSLDGSDLSAEIEVLCSVYQVPDAIEVVSEGAEDTTLKEKRYYTIDGKQIASPAMAGGIYIEWSIYSNGQIVSRKIMKK